MTLVPNVTETVISLPLHGDWSLADPGQMRVIKRDGHEVSYDPDKIFQAVSRCMVSVNRPEATVLALATQVMDQVDHILRIKARKADGGLDPINIEVIQNIVEIQLMALGHHDAAKHYILYRDERRRLREESSKISPDLREKFKAGNKYFDGLNPLLQQIQAFDKFSRFDYTLGRREVWTETVDRTIRYVRGHAQEKFPDAVPESVWTDLHKSLLHLESSPSMRLVQMAGPALEREQIGCYNCAFLDLDSPTSFAEDLFILMSGTGVGFSVEGEFAVDKWDRIKTGSGKSIRYVVEDTAESWADSHKFGIETWMEGGDVEFDYSLVRPAGSPLRVKGGRASGPGPLRDLHKFTRNTILSRKGRRLTSLNLHDIACMTHRSVQMGGVRRASGISLSDLDDPLMRNAKKGQFWADHPHRNQANDSAVYTEKPSAVDFMAEWLSLAESRSGERGIFNASSLPAQIPARRDPARLRCNPSLRKGTRVWTSEGIFPIESLEEKSFKVRNLDGEESPATCFLSGRDQTLYEIKISGNYSYFATAEHRWPVFLKNGDIVKKTTLELGKGDRIPIPNKVESLGFGHKGTYNEGFLAGWILGDGWISPTEYPKCMNIGMKVSIEDMDDGIHDLLLDTLEQVSDTQANFCPDDRDGYIPCYVLRTENNKLSAWAESIGLKGKSFGLPTLTWQEGSEDFRKGLIDGLISSDGSVDVATETQSFVGFTTKFDILAQDLADLLGFYGIKTSYTSGWARSTKKYPESHPSYGKKYRWNRIKILGQRDVWHFARILKLTHSRKRDCLYRFEGPRGPEYMVAKSVIVRDVIPTNIKEDVWDISVFDKTHCFALSHCVTGNCGEIYLRDKEFCNLSIGVIRPGDSVEEIRRKVHLATVWGTIQASMTRFHYLRDEWRKNCEEEALLGVDLLGHLDHDLLRPGSHGREDLLRSLLRECREVNIEWARRIGINPSRALTCGKPSGDSSVFFGCAAGFMPYHGRYYIRRLRMGTKNPVARLLKDFNVPHMTDYDGSGLLVFEIPARSPEGAILQGDLSAVEQLENWKVFKINWTEHNPSITIYVRDHEWLAAGNWVYENWDIVGGLSFLPFDGGIYPQAPYQTLTEEEYNQRMASMPAEIDWSRITLYEQSDMTELAGAFACTGRGCDS